MRIRSHLVFTVGGPVHKDRIEDLDYTWNFFKSILFISIKAQIFGIYLIIYHLFKPFAQAQLKSAMLIKKLKCIVGGLRKCNEA